MVQVVFRSPLGDDFECDAAAGETVMAVARYKAVRGIEAECGGGLSCGTCHVYVTPPESSDLPDASSDEDGMLEAVAAERRPNSRLACQIVLTPKLNGLLVEIPSTQF